MRCPRWGRAAGGRGFEPKVPGPGCSDPAPSTALGRTPEDRVCVCPHGRAARASSSVLITADVREAGVPFAQEPCGFPRGVWAPEATSPAPCQPPVPQQPHPPGRAAGFSGTPFSLSHSPHLQTLLSRPSSIPGTSIACPQGPCLEGGVDGWRRESLSALAGRGQQGGRSNARMIQLSDSSKEGGNPDVL